MSCTLWAAWLDRTIVQLESTLHATEITLDLATLEKLGEVFPGAGGEPPKAYA